MLETRHDREFTSLEGERLGSLSASDGAGEMLNPAAASRATARVLADRKSFAWRSRSCNARSQCRGEAVKLFLECDVSGPPTSTPIQSIACRPQTVVPTPLIEPASR